MQYILCADIGTTSLKTGIFSETGEVVSFCSRSFNTENSSFIANQWVNAFYSCAKKLCTGIPVSAVCISGNGPTLVSENGRTLLWNNPLSNELKDKLPETTSLYLPQFAAFKHFFPDEWNASENILSGPEFLIWKLTGKAVTILPEERFLKAYWTEEELNLFNIEKSKVPPFAPLGFNAGFVKPNILKELNLSGNIPVIAGGPDFIAALIGTNTLESGKLCDRSGSSEGINYCTDRPFFAENLRTLPSVIPGLWNISYIIPESGSLINEYKNEISAMEGIELSYEEIINSSFEDKNSEGWKILSTLSKNVRTGLLTLKASAEKNGLKFPDTMSITGGQAKNPKWLSKKAEDCGINISVGVCYDSELTGNLYTALFTLGKYSSIKEAAGSISKIKETYRSEKKSDRKMEIFSIPENLKTIIFDIDSTLYTNAEYAFEQVDCQIRHWAQNQGISEREARNKISLFRKKWSKTHGGKKISLGNTFINFGVSIEDSVQMRKTLLEPSKFLSRDEKLIETISKLKLKFKIICVTNNPVLPARKTLEAIGISDLIPEIIGLDTSGKSKPAPEPFLMACRLTDSKPEECLSIGDRFDMDISLPLEMGMGGILVTGVKDVYKLTELLIK